MQADSLPYDREVIHYLPLRDVAAHSGLAVNTIKGYARKGLLPSPDATIGTYRGWHEETIEAWMHARRTASNPQQAPEATDHLPLG